MKKLIIFILTLSGIFTSCSTDFEINAPYKETMVIYGLLNTLDTAQYIRISKAYLGEGNALIMAQEPDSINYADILDVKLERWYAGGFEDSGCENGKNIRRSFVGDFSLESYRYNSQG